MINVKNLPCKSKLYLKTNQDGTKKYNNGEIEFLKLTFSI